MLRGPSLHKLSCAFIATLSVIISSSTTQAGVEEYRSAFLGPGAWQQGLSASEVNSQLRQHFQKVLQTLDERSSISLAVALNRAEQLAARPWTMAQRRQVYSLLAERRQQQIQRLEQYAARGRFPLNEGQSKTAAPIFVDNHGTLCAVGYLVHIDQRNDLIADVVRADNLVRILSVRHPGFLRWVLGSGLTLEEAALIQPSYSLPLDATINDFLTPDFVATKHGISVSDFTYRRVELAIDSSQDQSLSTTQIIDNAWAQGLSALNSASPTSFEPGAGLKLGAGDIVLDFGGLAQPNRLDNWLYIGPSDAISGTLLGGREGAFADGYAQMFSMEYSLELERDLFTSFGQRHRISNLGNDTSEFGGSRFISQIFDGETDALLAEVEHEQVLTDIRHTSVNHLSSIADFSSRQIRVKTYGITVDEDAGGDEHEYHSVVFELGVSSVPEPYSLSLIALAMSLGSMTRFKKRSARHLHASSD